MYINVSRYQGAAGKIGEAAPKVQQGFVPMLKGQQGFLGYAAFAGEQGDIVSLHIWENTDALANAGPRIRDWVQANLPDFVEPTERVHGEVGPHALMAPQSGGLGQSFYCIVRKAENLASVTVHRPVVEEMLAAVQKVPGFRGGYWFRSAEDQTKGASVLFFDNREHAQTAHGHHEEAAAERHRPSGGLGNDRRPGDGLTAPAKLPGRPSAIGLVCQPATGPAGWRARFRPAAPDRSATPRTPHRGNP
jgi:heme-degrading monooxygenase HmoA